MRSTMITNEKRQHIVDLYQHGKSMTAVATLVGVSYNTVHRWLHKAGIQVRKTGPPGRSPTTPTVRGVPVLEKLIRCSECRGYFEAPDLAVTTRQMALCHRCVEGSEIEDVSETEATPEPTQKRNPLESIDPTAGLQKRWPDLVEALVEKWHVWHGACFQCLAPVDPDTVLFLQSSEDEPSATVCPACAKKQASDIQFLPEPEPSSP